MLALASTVYHSISKNRLQWLDMLVAVPSRTISLHCKPLAPPPAWGAPPGFLRCVLVGKFKRWAEIDPPTVDWQRACISILWLCVTIFGASARFMQCYIQYECLVSIHMSAFSNSLQVFWVEFPASSLYVETHGSHNSVAAHAPAHMLVVRAGRLVAGKGKCTSASFLGVESWP